MEFQYRESLFLFQNAFMVFLPNLKLNMFFVVQKAKVPEDFFLNPKKPIRVGETVNTKECFPSRIYLDDGDTRG